jgi:hypothetical protein
MVGSPLQAYGLVQNNTRIKNGVRMAVVRPAAVNTPTMPTTGPGTGSSNNKTIPSPGNWKKNIKPDF